MNITPMDEHGLIRGSNREVEFQALMNVPLLDLTPINIYEEGDKFDHDFRGAPYSYLYEDDKRNLISAMGWNREAVLNICNFFLRYLKKKIEPKDVIVDPKYKEEIW